MTTAQRNILAILANANNQFDGKIAFCVQNADMLRHKLFEVSQNDLQDLGFGKLQSEAFFSSLTFIAGCKGISRQTNATKAHIAHIVSLLKDANKKLAAIENTEYDAKVAEIADLPKVAELIAKATEVRNLTAELENCNEARFFEIANAINEIGYSYQTNFSATNLLEQVLAVFGKFENYEFFSNCPKFYTGRLAQESLIALRDAAIRLQLLYIYDKMGEVITEYCYEVEGMQPLYVLDKIVGWYNEVAQPTPAQTVLTAAQSIQQQADAAELPLNEYIDLHPEAGFEFETPNFIGKDFDLLDLLEYKHRYEKISQIELDFSQPKNKRFDFIESFYQYCMWHAYQRYTKNFKPVVALCASQTLRNSKKPVIFAAELRSDLFDIGLDSIYPTITGELNLQFNSFTNCFEFLLLDSNSNFANISPLFDFCDDLGDFAETCNKRWSAQGNTHTGNLYNDYPIFSFFADVLLNL